MRRRNLDIRTMGMEQGVGREALWRVGWGGLLVPGSRGAGQKQECVCGWVGGSVAVCGGEVLAGVCAPRPILRW